MKNEYMNVSIRKKWNEIEKICQFEQDKENIRFRFVTF